MGGLGRLKLPATLGRYQLIAEIAQGGMATVYLARMIGKAGFERVVAIKVLHHHLSSDPEFVAMFLDEARLAARISHPNVVDVFDVDAIDGELIIVMTYVEGMSLSRIIRRSFEGDSLEIGFALRVVHDMLLGLHAAHELTDQTGTLVNLIHRDVSPHNLLVGADGVTRVVDFGVAKARGRVTSTSKDTVKGKLRYLAPEQLMRTELDRRVDVFAAGAVLWETLVGRPLFRAESEAQTMSMILSGDLPTPSSQRSGVPGALDTICMKALARDRDERFASAAEFAEALEDEFGSAMLTARKVGKIVNGMAAARIEQMRAATKAVAPLEATPISTQVPPSFSDAGRPANPDGSGTTDGAATIDTASVSVPMVRNRRMWAGIAAGVLAVGTLLAWQMKGPGEPHGDAAASSKPARTGTTMNAVSSAASAPAVTSAPSASAAPSVPSAAPSASASARVAAPGPSLLPSRPPSGFAPKKKDGMFIPQDL